METNKPFTVATRDASGEIAVYRASAPSYEEAKLIVMAEMLDSGIQDPVVLVNVKPLD